MIGKYRRWIFGGLILILLAALAVLALTPAKQTGTSVGMAAPEFTLKDMKGNPVSLKDFAGKPVFINFWASWCPPCKLEMPDLQEAYQKYGGQVAFLMVNLTTSEKMGQPALFLGETGYTFPVLLDTELNTANGLGKVASLYQVNSIPQSFFIDKKGIIQAKYLGPMDMTIFEENLQKILSH